MVLIVFNGVNYFNISFLLSFSFLLLSFLLIVLMLFFSGVFIVVFSGVFIVVFSGVLGVINKDNPHNIDSYNCCVVLVFLLSVSGGVWFCNL